MPLAQLGLLAQQAQQVRQVLPDRQALLAQRVPLEPLEQQEPLGPLGLQERLAPQVHKV